MHLHEIFLIIDYLVITFSTLLCKGDENQGTNGHHV